MFSFYKRHNDKLYNSLVKLSRNIFFYKELKLQDNFDTRAILILLHLSIVIIAVKDSKNQKFPQKIFDNIFLNIEYHLREMGDGDVAVNKKMKIINKIFYDILLKIKKNEHNSFKLNEETLKKHFFNNMKVDDAIMAKFNSYLISFYNFCFELDYNNMLKEDINFKYV